MRRLWAAAALALGVALGFGLAAWAQRPGPPVGPRPVTPRGALPAEERRTIDLFSQSAPSVVSITNLALLRRPFTLDANAVPQGVGSGFLGPRAPSGR